MSIETQITEMLKEAMRSKDQPTKDVIAMIKTKHMERRTAGGFKGPLDDSLWLEVIAAYQKQAKKSREEYAALGDKGADNLAPLDFEIAFCAKFLPQMAGDDEVRVAAREAVARMAITDPKQAGRVVGDIMKTNKGKFDPGAVKRIVEEEMARAAAK